MTPWRIPGLDKVFCGRAESVNATVTVHNRGQVVSGPLSVDCAGADANSNTKGPAQEGRGCFTQPIGSFFDIGSKCGGGMGFACRIGRSEIGDRGAWDDRVG